VHVDGPLYKSAGRLQWKQFNNFDVITKEVGDNFTSSLVHKQVRKQFVSFLRLDPNNGSYIKTERRKIYQETRYKTFTRMEADITFNNSMLAANGINYTCPPFKQLVKEFLNSRYFYSNTSHFTQPTNILGSLFSGILYHNASLVRDTEKLVKENKSMQVQADVCRQFISSLVHKQVRKQFVSFLRLDPNNGSYIKTERRKIYQETRYKTFTRMEADITFNNSMLAANGINYTCPPFKQLVKEFLNSRYFYSNTSHFTQPTNILG
ncbi:uncharacterized protein DEA37_0000650, partial [Paragonimus westermani]